VLTKLKRQVFGKDKSEEGQVLFILIVVITVILVVGVIVVDIGLWISERRQVQSAADMAALAAATELRNSPAAASAKGQEYARKNGFDNAAQHISVAVTPRFSGNPDLVEVVIEEESPALFGEIFGLANMDIGARAVARVQDVPTPQYAMFATDSSCSDPHGILLNDTENGTYRGAVHSNSDIDIDDDSEDNDFIGPTTYVCSGGFDDDGDDNSFNPPPQRVSTRPSPLTYGFSDFPCTRTFNGDVELDRVNSLWVNNNPNTRRLRDNVICATDDITLDTDNVQGRVTLVADDEIDITGDDAQLTPFWNNVLMYAGSNNNDAIEIDDDDGRFTGFIYAPNGQVSIDDDADDTRITGSIVAQRIRIRADRVLVDVTGFAGAVGLPNIWLIE
jgi:hypothetical protein